jgi:undecaprenyl-diphosphatase
MTEEISMRLGQLYRGGIWKIILFITLPLLFFASIFLLVRNHSIQKWDENIISSIQNYRTPFLDRIFQIITNSGSGLGRSLVLVPMLIYFWRRKLRLEAWTLAGAALLGQLITWSVKYIANRPRPDVITDLDMPTDPSFPSGHALGSAILYGWLAVWMGQRGYRKSSALMIIWALLIAFSRVYFGVHYLSDVLASLSLSIPWLTLVFTLYDRQKRSQQ